MALGHTNMLPPDLGSMDYQQMHGGVRIAGVQEWTRGQGGSQ